MELNKLSMTCYIKQIDEMRHIFIFCKTFYPTTWLSFMQIPAVINDILKHIVSLHFQINRTDEYKTIPFDPQQF